VLENGWRSTTPDDDNVLVDAGRVIVAAYADLAEALGGSVFEQPELGLHLMDLHSPSLFMNQAHLTRPLGPDEVPAVAAALQEAYQPPGGPYLVFASYPTPDFGPHGFTLEGHPPLMLRLPSTHDLPGAPEGLRIERVTTEAGLADFERTLIEGYPVPDVPIGRPGDLLPPDVLRSAWHFYVGYEGDRPVTTAAAWVGERLSLVEMVATRPESRGRGYGAAITTAALVTDYTRWAVLLASDPGRPIYEMLGFFPVVRFTLWVGTRAA